MVLLLVLIVYYIHTRIAKSFASSITTEKSEKNLSTLLRRYVFLSLLFLYMIFPSISAVIFSIFNCTDTDPDNVNDADDGSLYLDGDYSISCSSSRYKAAKIYASLMVILYPMGIPAVFFGVLYYYREGIKNRTLNNKARQPCYVIEFLWFPYTPSFWYFEFLDIVYRVSVTGFLVLVKQGSAEQILVGLTLSFFYAQYHQHVRPHEDTVVQNMKILTIWQIFFLLVVLLLIERDVIVGHNTTVSIMILVNAFLPCLMGLCYITYLMWRYHQLKKEVRTTDIDPSSDDQYATRNTDDLVTLVLRTTIVHMRESSFLSPRPTNFDTDNVSLVELKHRRSECVVEEGIDEGTD